MRSTRDRSDRGAAAVEFALVVPVLLLLVLGILEFGRAFNAQVSLTAAARESVRVMAVENDVDAAVTVASDAAVSLNPSIDASHVEISPTVCAPGTNVTVTITYPFEFVTGTFGPEITLTGQGMMRCGG
ncbi:MAG: TadE/TadG family type IV pilus assembly protein [Nitriliruptoraceae bacterium]